MNWQEELKNSYRDLPSLLKDLHLDPRKASDYSTHFPLKIPRPFARRMRRSDWGCPLLRQVLPPLEGKNASLAQQNPLLEDRFVQAQGVLQKFSGRVLVLASSHCAVHCQYCFRQDFPYSDHRRSRQQRLEQVEHWRGNTNLREIILSGGDPLSLSDTDLRDWVRALATLPQLKVIRFHTRFPVVVPSRLTEELKKCWQGHDFPQGRMMVVLHINHAAEIDDELARVLKSWQQQGVMFLNQAVLLRGVNDSTPAQEELWWRCFESGVGAYYLHQMDGIAHADDYGISIEQGQELMAELRSRLPGYLMPRYVQEVPFESSKVVLS